MREYHKIQSVFKRDEKTHKFIAGDWSIPEFGYLANCEWVGTEKVDGMNIRVVWDGAEVKFFGKTDAAMIPPQLLENLAALFPAAKFGEVEPFTLYGEGYGAKIQKGGGNYRPDQSFVLFDVRVGDWWLRRDDVSKVAVQFGLDEVPTKYAGNLHDAIALVQGGIMSEWGDFRAEGLVLRPAVELQTRGGHRIITKIKTKDF